MIDVLLHSALVDFLEVTRQTTLPEEGELQRQTQQNGPAAKRMRGILHTYGYEAIKEAWLAPVPVVPVDKIYKGAVKRGTELHNHPSQLTTTVGDVLESFPTHPTRPTAVNSWLLKNGFNLKKSNAGSHSQWVGPSGHKVTVPVHAKDLPQGTLRAIRAQVERGLSS